MKQTFQNTIEILFIARSNRDSDGKRVLIRVSGVENIVYPEDKLTQGEAGLLGLTPQAQQEIKQFFEVE